MNDRIKELRKALGLNQTKFGARIGIKQGTVAGYENGTRVPLDTVIVSICREFNVNETWLRTGEGEMFRPVDRREEMARFWEEVSGAPLDDIRVRLVDVLSRLTKNDWDFIERRARELVAEVRAENGDVSDSDTKTAAPAEAETAVQDDGATAEAEALYRKSLKIAPRGASSASNTTGGGDDPAVGQ